MMYQKRANSLVFQCLAVDENDDATVSLLKQFVLDMSKEKRVFFESELTIGSEVPKMIDPETILTSAQTLLMPRQRFFYLSKGRVHIDNFDGLADEATIYCFSEEVDWSDFLAAHPIINPIKYIKRELLSMYFLIGGHDSQFWFECNKVYEKEVLQLFDRLSNLGHEVILASNGCQD
jgi:hypothetical protein